MLRAVILIAAARTTAAYHWHLYENLTCSDFDDDSMYTSSTCSTYDEKSCETYCLGNEYCALLCGEGSESCDTGSGAVCAMYALGSLTETCQSIEDVPHFTPGVLPDGVLDNDASVGGCDSHAYCSFCEPFEQCRKTLHHYAPIILGEIAWKEYAKIGKGPLAMVLLANISAICDIFDAEEAQKLERIQSDLETPNGESGKNWNMNAWDSMSIFMFGLMGTTAFIFAATALVVRHFLHSKRENVYESIREDPTVES